jgi:hypothetical protein
VNAGRSPVPAIAVTAAAFAVAGALITGLLLGWPLTSPVVAALRLLAWTLAAAYAIAPVLALGLALTRKSRQENEVGCSRLIAAWGVGWAAVVLVGTVMLASGLYFETVWVALASAGNLALVGFLVVRRWQPLRELRAMAVSAWDRWRARGLIGWDLAILLCLASAALLASLPPDARDELVYHLALPQFWRFQHDWWVPVDNLHWLFPANAEVIWGYGMAVGGVHLPRLLTFAFGLATVALLADWLAEAGHDPWVTRVSVLFLVLAPMPLVLLGICNAEWPLLFFLLLGWRAGRLYLESPRVPVLVLTALAWGVCLGFKYTAFPVVAVLALEWLVALARRHGSRRALPAGAALVLAAALLAGGWLFRNWRTTGDPLYPLGTTLVGAAVADPAPDVGRPARLLSAPGALEPCPVAVPRHGRSGDRPPAAPGMAAAAPRRRGVGVAPHRRPPVAHRGGRVGAHAALFARAAGVRPPHRAGVAVPPRCPADGGAAPPSPPDGFRADGSARAHLAALVLRRSHQVQPGVG